jgi:transposase
MNELYNQQHQFYCGVDLHANSLYVCVVDSAGKKRLHENFLIRNTRSLLTALKPFRQDLVVGCESTFNWYWLCDLCESNKIPFVLGHALYLKAIHAGKVKNDKVDSEKLAYLLRGGNFACGYAYPAAWRSTRDLLRRRMHLVRRRGETLTHISHSYYQYNLPPTKKLQYASIRPGVAEAFADQATRYSVELDLELLEHYDTLIKRTEVYLERAAKVHDANNFYLLQTIPGVGRILAMTLLSEIHKIGRFPTVGKFLSYARLVRGKHESAGKNHGSPGSKIGNANLKWAFSEIVPLIKRQCHEVKAYCERLERRHCKARANAIVAAKLGRAMYFMLRRREVFSLDKLLSRQSQPQRKVCD